MKKFLSMTLLFAAMFLTFSACSNDDSVSLSGTEWIAKYADDNYIIVKFISDSSVEGYFTDTNFIMMGNISSGTYSIKDDKVSFDNFIVKYYGIASYKYESAHISGSTMETIYCWKYNNSSSWYSPTTKVFSKK